MAIGWVVPLALLVGVVIGVFGAGGALITVPLLVLGFGQPIQAATTGSLIIVTLSALAGLAENLRRGRVRVGDGLIFGGCGMAGAAVGSLASAAVDQRALMVMFGCLLVAVAVTLLRSDELAGSRIGWPGIVAAALLVGFLTGFFGVGGGFAVVPALVLLLGFGIKDAIGTSLLVIVLNGVAALLTRTLPGGAQVDWALIGPFAVIAALGTLAGTRLGARLPAGQLRTTFAGLLVAIAAYVLLDSIAGLVR